MRVTTMTEAAEPPSPVLLMSLPPDTDDSFGFLLKDWKDFPDIDIPPEHLSETQNERVKRIYEETVQRNDTTPTAWHRFATLGRNIMSFTQFESLWNNFDNDQLQLHLVVWYRYMYHIDRKFDVPQKLHAWANTFSLPYLSVHTDKVLPVDTTTIGFEDWAKRASNIYSWNKVISSAKAKRRTQTRKATSTLKKTPIVLKTTDLFKQQLAFTTPPIPEEQDDEPMEVDLPIPEKTAHKNPPIQLTSNRPPIKSNLQATNMPSISHTHANERKEDSHSFTSSTDGKMSALIPNLNIPINDGTIRISLRWKPPADVVALALSQKSSALSAEIHSLLNDIFRDEDGLLYRWTDEGTEHCNSISKMSQEELRSYIAPSLSVLPSQSQIIVPIRFGFTTKPSFSWKNQPRVQEAFKRNKVTASFSNSKSTSGDDVISGYILLKAPRTTHRTRFLQSLRSKLPDTTPFFDIFLHRRTPFDQDINHLVVQCGKNHVHSLSQTLLSALDGSGTGVYIPRFAFAKMTTAEAMKLFEKHDSYIKSLRYIQLSPMINNLDTVRTEFFPDGTKMERTTRDWAASITSAEGQESAHVDVVNGGYDQKSFLLMAPQHEDTVRKAFEEYCRRVFPFSIREERFRDAIGPPPTVIHVVSKVNANLSFIDKLISSTESWKQTRTAGSAETSDESDSRSESLRTPTRGAEDHNSSSNSVFSQDGDLRPSVDTDKTSKPTMPPTPLDSLRDQYGLRSTVQTEASTDSNHSINSRLSSMSTSTARFQEIEARIQRQQKEFDRKDRINTERLERMERQFTRFDDLDHRFDVMQGNLMNVMETQAGVGGTVNNLSDKISALMDMIAQTHIQNGQTKGSHPMTIRRDNVEDDDDMQHSTSPEPPNRQLDRVTFSSPIKKKYRTGCKEQDPEEDHVAASQHQESDNLAPLSQAVNTPLPVDDNTPDLLQHATTKLDDIATDLESRYNDKSSQGGESAS